MRWCTFDGKKPSAWLSVYFRKIVTQSLVMSQFVSICCMCHSLLACVCTFSTSNWQLIGNLVQVGGMCRLKIILSFAAFTLHLLNLSVTALHGTRFCVGNSVRESGPAPPSMFNIPPSGTLEIKILVHEDLGRKTPACLENCPYAQWFEDLHHRLQLASGVGNR